MVMRLTKKGTYSYEPIRVGRLYDAMDKLGHIEDIMEKYNINSAEELERVILNDATGEQAFKEYAEPYQEIEKELGIDLVTVFKILKNKVCYMHYGLSLIISCNIWGCDTRGVIVTNEGYHYAECQHVLEWKDYKKTWALTKEELENER